MERKTSVNAEEGRPDLVIVREFDLPVDLLFRAYVEADIVEQWMGTKVLKLENKPFGVQLEILEFEKLSDDTSKLNMHVVYESVAHRDQNLKLPFKQGIN